MATEFDHEPKTATEVTLRDEAAASRVAAFDRRLTRLEALLSGVKIEQADHDERLKLLEEKLEHPLAIVGVEELTKYLDSQKPIERQSKDYDDPRYPRPR